MGRRRSNRENALRAGNVERYVVKGRRISLYWEAHGEYVKTGKYQGMTSINRSFTVDIDGDPTHAGERLRFDTLHAADKYIFEMRDKTPVDLAMRVFDIVITPDDD